MFHIPESFEISKLARLNFVQLEEAVPQLGKDFDTRKVVLTFSDEVIPIFSSEVRVLKREQNDCFGHVAMVAGIIVGSPSQTADDLFASRMRYVEHIEQYGTALFQRVCKMGLGRNCGEAQLWTLHDRAGTADVGQD